MGLVKIILSADKCRRGCHQVGLLHVERILGEGRQPAGAHPVCAGRCGRRLPTRSDITSNPWFSFSLPPSVHVAVPGLLKDSGEVVAGPCWNKQRADERFRKIYIFLVALS